MFFQARSLTRAECAPPGPGQGEPLFQPLGDAGVKGRGIFQSGVLPGGLLRRAIRASTGFSASSRSRMSSTAWISSRRNTLRKVLATPSAMP